KLARRWRAALRPPCTQQADTPPTGKDDASIDRQSDGPVGSRARVYAILGNGVWLGGLGALGPGLFLRRQSGGWGRGVASRTCWTLLRSIRSPAARRLSA